MEFISEFLSHNDNYIFVSVILILILEYFVIFLFDKKCKKSHLKIILTKTFLLSAFIILVLLIIRQCYVRFILNLDVDNDIRSNIYLILCCILSFPGVKLMMGDIDLTKQNIYDIPYKSFKEWNDFLKSKLLSKEYRQLYCDDNLQIYKKQKNSSIEIFVSSEIKDLTSEKINGVYKKVRELLREEYEYIENKQFSKMMMTFIVSTNKITSDFNSFVKSVDIDKRIFKLPVGISFGGKKLYLSNVIDGFDMPFQNKMYKDFLKLVEIKCKRR